ncbi:MAG: hypothetical protein KAI91_03555, partial [Candidatus Omnitrophica bacterium]|nr:hypothetical protein [Candidatus Omnitrophota bacterium]
SGERIVSRGALSEYLNFMIEVVKDVPFVFRDNMNRFVNNFLGLKTDEKNKPDLSDTIEQIANFLISLDLGEIKYVITSGIGANEMYSHQLARVFNKFFGSKVTWIVVNNPAHLKVIPEEANNKNTLVFEMSRSGGTKETIDFFMTTFDIFKKRIVAAEKGELKKHAENLENQEDAHVLKITDIRGDIGGRQMNRLTLMVYAPLFIALSAGLKDTGEAKVYLQSYVAALNKANDELGYAKGLDSLAVSFAEFLLRHRASGRKRFTLVYDDSLKYSAKELFQLINEGANKNIAGGSNNNILTLIPLSQYKEIYKKMVINTFDSQLIILLFENNTKYKGELKECREDVSTQDIPNIEIGLDISDDNLENNLKVLARTSALLQDMTVYFTYITNQDANSNPKVKFVRELTGVGFNKVKDLIKNAKGKAVDIRITFAELIKGIDINQKISLPAIIDKIDQRRAKIKPYRKEFDKFRQAIQNLAIDLEISEECLTEIIIESIARNVVMTDVGEAGGSQIQEIEVAFERSGINDLLGKLSEQKVIKPLDVQVMLEDSLKQRVSVAESKDFLISYEHETLEENIAEYFYQMYQQRKDTLMYFALSFMEVDEDNPAIKSLTKTIIDEFSDLGVTPILLAFPGVAHTGFEAVASHPEIVFNLAVLYTNTYGEGLGTMEIGEGINVDIATYIYGVANVIRASLGGSPTAIIEIENAKALKDMEPIIKRALIKLSERVRKDIKSQAIAGIGANDGGKLLNEDDVKKYYKRGLGQLNDGKLEQALSS